MKELIERIEAGSGPDRELDLAIVEAVWGLPEGVTVKHAEHFGPWYENAPDGMQPFPCYFTSSIDAAMMLAPDTLDDFWASQDKHGEGKWTVGIRTSEGTFTADGETYNLAFCAAFLKAQKE